MAPTGGEALMVNSKKLSFALVLSTALWGAVPARAATAIREFIVPSN